MRKIALLILFFLLIPSVSQATVIADTRRVTWQGNVGFAACDDVHSTYYTQATCQAAGGTWYTDFSTYAATRTNVRNCKTYFSGHAPTGDGVTDDTTNIQYCVNNVASGEVAYLPAGTYVVSAPITLLTYRTLRGAGAGSTIIKTTTSSGISYFKGILAMEGADFGSIQGQTPVDLSSGYTKGSTTLTTSSAHGLSPGNIVFIDQLNSETTDPPTSIIDSEGVTSGNQRHDCYYSTGSAGAAVCNTDPYTTTPASADSLMHGAPVTLPSGVGVNTAYIKIAENTGGATECWLGFYNEGTPDAITSSGLNVGYALISNGGSAIATGWQGARIAVSGSGSAQRLWMQCNAAVKFATTGTGCSSTHAAGTYSSTPPSTITAVADSPDTCVAVSLDPYRSRGQTVRAVEGTTGSTINLEIPLYFDFTSTLKPQVMTAPMSAKNIGLENLTLDISSITNDDQEGLSLSNAQNSWVSGVEVKVGTLWHCNTLAFKTYRNTFRQMNMNGLGNPGSPGLGYGFCMWYQSSGNLIENNIMNDIGTPIIIDDHTTGNVWAYNYMLSDPLRSGDSYLQHGAIAIHEAYPAMNLWEGNIVRGLNMADYYHGNSGWNTLVRNKFYLDTSHATSMNWLWNVDKKSQYYNFVGNVLGTVGYETTWTATGSTVDFATSKIIFRLGYQDNTGVWQTAATPSYYGAADTGGYVASTILLHGNWDSIQGGQRWDGTISDHVIPPSYYLSAKPSWYPSSCNWPPIDPTAPTVYQLPAGQRYANSGSEVCTDTTGSSSTAGNAGGQIHGGILAN